jgi:triacylglycerol lipase
MPNIDFDAKTRNFSAKNAALLGKASQVVYKPAAQAQGEVTGWGLTEFQPFNKLGTQAFIAGNSEALVLAFRGTEPGELQDWMTDINVALVGGPGGRVHEGFFAALSSVWRDVWKYISQERKSRSLWVTGHSLGAALATIAVAKLRLEKDEPVNGLYTFGQPRTSDRDFAKNFDGDFGSQTFRYVNNNDIVPRVPFRSMSYSHIGTFKYFDSNGDQRDDISWWDKIVDRVRGGFDDLLAPGTDGIKDHSMENYIANLDKNK